MTNEAPESDSPIESLTKKLYTAGNESLTELRRAGFRQPAYDVSDDFTHDHEPQRTMKRIVQHHTTVKWFFIGAVVFFFAALTAAFFFLSGDRNIVSAQKIDIAISGPVIVASGNTLPLAIEIRNRNATALQISDVVIEYPPGTRSPEDSAIELPRERLSLGTIEAGARVATGTRAVLFAPENSEQKVHVTLEYRVAGSNAILVKKADFAVRIGSSPLSVSVSAPRQVNSGREMEIVLSVTSNTAAPLKDVVLAAEYPFGFSYKNASPSPSLSTTMWSFDEIEPEGKRTIRITGTLSGQDGEDRIFRFRTGLASPEDDTELATAFAEIDHRVAILRPFVDTTVAINGQSSDTVTIAPGADTRIDVSWRNNLPSRITDGIISVRITGDAVDERSVSALKGFYSSLTDTVTWDKRGVPDLAFIDAGAGGSVSLAFKTVAIEQGSSGRIDPDVRIAVSFSGRAVSESGVPEEIRTDVERLARISSTASLSARAVRTVGPLETMGPIPPRVEQKTTYTVLWSVANAVNDISNVVVRATLPPYVSWEGVYSPSGEDIRYDSASGVVTWRAGTVLPGAGYSTPARTVAFQVGLTPSATQIGTAPTLVQASTLTALDEETQRTIQAQANPLTTAFLTDPGFVTGQEKVTE